MIAGTFDDVVHAYDRGAITIADYAVLVQPAAHCSPVNPRQEATTKPAEHQAANS